MCSSLEQLRFAVLRGFEREDSEELGRRIRDFSSTLLSWGARLQRQREGRTLAQVKAGGAGPRPAEPAGPEGAPSASSPATTSKAAPEVPKASRTPERRRRKESKRSRSSRRRRSPGRARHRRREASASPVRAPVPPRDPPPPAPRALSPAELPVEPNEVSVTESEEADSPEADVLRIARTEAVAPPVPEESGVGSAWVGPIRTVRRFRAVVAWKGGKNKGKKKRERQALFRGR